MNQENKSQQKHRGMQKMNTKHYCGFISTTEQERPSVVSPISKNTSKAKNNSEDFLTSSEVDLTDKQVSIIWEHTPDRSNVKVLGSLLHNR